MIQTRSDKETTYLKLETLEDIKYMNNFNLVSSVLLKWSKIKKNPDLNSMIEAMNEIAFYNLKLKRERDDLLEIISTYRADKIRAIERARRCEEKIQN
jgi:hypothetical protein